MGEEEGVFVLNSATGSEAQYLQFLGATAITKGLGDAGFDTVLSNQPYMDLMGEEEGVFVQYQQDATFGSGAVAFAMN